MNFQIVVFLFLSVFFSFKQENPDELLWQSDKKLTWENFKGKPDSNSKHTAISVCSIKVKYHSKKDTLFVKVWAVLKQSKSWTKNRNAGLHLLNHERLHFDIAELYARKLRQSITLLKTKKTEAATNFKALEKINNENLTQYQKLYDKETDHSRVKSKQSQWEKKVAAELKTLNEFRNTEIRLLLKST